MGAADANKHHTDATCDGLYKIIDVSNDIKKNPIW